MTFLGREGLDIRQEKLYSLIKHKGYSNMEDSKNATKKFTVTHGMSNTATYKIWSGIFTRCYNTNSKTYKFYGAKGIEVDEAWRSFETFLSDMGERHKDMQIDRIDNLKGYCKENCRWITKEENTKRQNNRYIDISGMRFSNWYVVDRDTTKLDRDKAYFNCICDCGTRTSIAGSSLRTGKTKRCVKCQSKSHRGWFERYKSRRE